MPSYCPSRHRGDAASAAVLWKAVDEGWIRYDQRSGETHLLAPLSRFIVELLEASADALSMEAIVAAVAAADGDSDSDASPEACRQAVDAALQVLLEAHFIVAAERARP